MNAKIPPALLFLSVLNDILKPSFDLSGMNRPVHNQTCIIPANGLFKGSSMDIVPAGKKIPMGRNAQQAVFIPRHW